MIIKEAFEMIKNQKGKGVILDDERKKYSDFQSVRPNPDQYREDFKTEFQDSDSGAGMDYKENYHKTPDDQEHETLKKSFKEMEMMRNIKFNPDNVEVPDASSKINLFL